MEKYPWIRIEDKRQFVFDIQTFHPNDPRWRNYWYEQKRRIIEGHWGEDFGKYRYMPANLYFTVNHGTIVDTDEKENTRRVIRPLLWDIMWEYAYQSLVAKGFSGFKEDDKYTCDERIFKFNKNKHKSESYLDLFSTNGKFKEYLSPVEYVRRLFDEPCMTPLYWNNTCNTITMGSRGGSKSYWTALGELLHELVTDGIKYYTEENRRNPPKINVLVGSGDTTKSAEICQKVYDAMLELGSNHILGVYGEPGDPDYTPNPLFKDMIGDIGPNNGDNKWKHEYEVTIGGRKIKKGTRSALHHVTYSENKRSGKGAQSGAGGRYNVSVIEEIGLTPLLLGVHKSNDAVVRIGTKYFGRQVLIGTSENIEAVQPAKEIFTHPRDYRMVEFDDVWEHTGKIGFYLPAYMTDGKFKDENGNTDFEEAKLHFEEVRTRKAESNNPDVLRGEKLNYPLIPSEMWLGTKAKILPYEEAADREKDLMKNHLYEKIGTPVTLSWNSQYPNGVKHEVNFGAKPIFNYPVRVDTDNVEGAIQIFSFPEEEQGIVPNDKYLAICDTYVSEALDAGGSLGVTYVILHPKYWHKMPPTGPIVASLIGKDASGLDGHLEKQEKLMAFYGNPVQGLWIEKNRIERYRDHYIKKKKHWILAPTPTSFLSKSAYQRVATEYGIPLSSKVTKLQWLDMLHDLLLQEIDVMGTKKRFIETIPCIYAIREIMAYDIDNGNFDAVSALLLLPVIIKELEYNLESVLKEKNNKNPLSFLSVNSRVFNDKMQLVR